MTGALGQTPISAEGGGISPHRLALLTGPGSAVAEFPPAKPPVWPQDRRRSSAGLWGVLVDSGALAVAALAAVPFGAGAHDGGRAGLPYVLAWAHLLPALPVLVVVLAAVRARAPFASTFGHHVAAVLPALAGGSLIDEAGWRLANGAGLGWSLPVDSLLALCVAGAVTVTAGWRMRDLPSPVLRARRRRAVIVGSGYVASRVAEQLASISGVEVVGLVDDDPLDDSMWVGKLCDLTDVCRFHHVDHVVVGFSRASSEELIEALRPIQGHVPITVVPRLFDIVPTTAVLRDLGSGLSGISVAPAERRSFHRACKRGLDVVAATACLVLLGPLLLLVAAAVKLSSRGPVLYQHERVGYHGRAFRMVKFRSMTIVSDQGWDGASSHAGGRAKIAGQQARGPFPKLKDDPRVTAVGRVIRRTSIDELPQLWNVLVGDMSLVGPRPYVPADAAAIEGWALRRYDVRPGITGWWQVSGRNDLTFEEMCRLDGLYVANWSLGLDLRILLRTPRAVLARRGAY